MMDTPATPPATLRRAREIALKNGVRYAYTGNVHDSRGGSTYCHGCGETLIGRDWHELSTWKLAADGHCANCGTRCAGRLRRPARHLGAQAHSGPHAPGACEPRHRLKENRRPAHRPREPDP